MRILMIKDVPSSSAYYRTLLPAKHLSSKFDIEINDFSLDKINHYDVFIIYKLPMYDITNTLDFLKSKNKIIIWDFDDDYWNLPEWNPYKNLVKTEYADALIKYADWITVTTAELGALIPDQNKVRVLPNLVDLQEWSEPQPIMTETPLGVGWAGSTCHEADIEILVRPVELLIDRWGKLFNFIFMGDIPEKFSSYSRIKGTINGKINSNHPQVQFIEPVLFPYYHSVLPNSGIDIGLCPLTYNNFNKCKSNIKFLEYTMAGIPTIAPDFYSEACCYKISDGYDAEEWVKAIKDLTSADARLHYYHDAKEFLLDNYTWQNSSAKWFNFFKELDENSSLCATV